MNNNLELYRVTHILWHVRMPVVFGLYNVFLVWRTCRELF